MKNKALIGIIVVLVLALVGETAYLVYLKKKPRLHSIFPRGQMQMPWPGGHRERFWEDFAPEFGGLEEWDPRAEMERIEKRMNRLFRDSFQRGMQSERFGSLFDKNVIFEPDIDIKETDTEYIVSVDLPGMNKDNINVEIKDNRMTITGERSAETETQTGHFHKQERSFGHFSRTIILPEDIKQREIKSEYKNGILRIRIPRTGQALQAGQSSIKVPVD